jgi:hypothetical protein
MYTCVRVSECVCVYVCMYVCIGDPKAKGGHFRELEEQQGPSRQEREEQQLEDAEFTAFAARHGVGFGAAHEAALAGGGGGGGWRAGGGGRPGEVMGGTEWKQEYYQGKLDLAPEDKDGLDLLIRKYIEGVCWCYCYYYRGCVSWRWFFPYHFAPLASDLTAQRLRGITIGFEIGIHTHTHTHTHTRTHARTHIHRHIHIHTYRDAVSAVPAALICTSSRLCWAITEATRRAHGVR